MQHQEFTIMQSSANNYDTLSAEISQDDQIICVLNQDGGPDNIVIEFFPYVEEEEKLAVSYSPFLEVLELAKNV
ncbi:MAG: hypothetical protein ABJN26_25320 [Stappiaceae bacterium]